MNTKQNNGGPDFPNHPEMPVDAPGTGMTLRDYFAATCQEDDRLVKCIRAMDDQDLEMFARFPGSEREEWITETNFHGMSEVEKIATRLGLEAEAIARVRFMQADAMLKARE